MIRVNPFPLIGDPSNNQGHTNNLGHQHLHMHHGHHTQGGGIVGINADGQFAVQMVERSPVKQDQTTNSTPNGGSSTNNNKLFTCDLCPYSTRNSGHLKRHLIVHGIGERKPIKTHKNHSCDLCPYSTRYPGHLKRHMIVHGFGERELGKIHNCGRCQYTTRYSGHLKRHMVVHGIGQRKPDKIHKCNLCPYSVRGSSLLNRHMLREHKISRRHICEYCSERFKTFPELRNHRFEHFSVNRKQLVN